MMVKPSVSELLKKADNRYELVIATARRARQIASGAEAKTDVKEESPVTLAANEIAEGKVEICSGVAGAGKDTIKKELIKRMDNVESLPSYTSRPMRNGDVEGGTYIFVSKEKFEEMIENGDFYEYDVHHDNYYGTSKKLLNEKINNGKIIVKDIDVNGTEHLKDLLKADTKVVTIFLRVSKEELERRLQERIDKPSPAEIRLRLSRFEYEESRINLYDYVLKNDNLEKTVQIIMTILENELKLLKNS